MELHESMAHQPPIEGTGQWKRCTRCHAIGYDEDIYCPHCGTPFARVCTGCGTPVSHPVAIYCVRCGRKLTALRQD